jgi:hypothetical protein
MPELKPRKLSCLLSILSLLSASTPAVAQEQPSVIFPAKTFFNSDQIVHIEGTLTGDGVGYVNNHTVLTCYQRLAECDAIQIDSQGMEVFSTNIPMPYVVRVWSADRILADAHLLCDDGFETWIIDRHKQTAELSERPCKDPKTYHWTLEDSAYWKKLKQH